LFQDDAVSADVASGRYAFVGVPPLWREEAVSLSNPLPSTTRLAMVLSAMNFDPSDYNPPGPTYDWFSLLINDFRENYSELLTIAEVNGGEIRRQLDWQPKINHQKTALVALVGSKRWIGMEGRAKIANALGNMLSVAAYDGVLLDCRCESAEELNAVASFALDLKRSSALSLLLLSNRNVDIRNSPFSFCVRQMIVAPEL
jgi:hypothetical protein